jgi:hypothetical protein
LTKRPKGRDCAVIDTFVCDGKQHSRLPKRGNFAKLPCMAAVTFDTLKFVKTLQAAGVSVSQAEAIATAVRDSHDSAELATKSDIRELELSMTIKLGAMMVVAIGIMATLVKLL